MDEDRPTDHDPVSPARRWIPIIKWLVAILVLVGLIVAARQAIDQWRHESGKLFDRIEAIDAELAQPASDQPLSEQRRASLQQQREHLRSNVPNLANLRWRWIGAAALLYAAALVLPSFLLRRALIALDQRPRVGTAIAAQLIGHVGKYVPGKAMVIVLRVAALARDDVRALAATVAVFVETFMLLAVGAAVAGVLVVWLPVPTWIAAASVAVAVAASLPTFPPVLRRLVARMSKATGPQIESRIGPGLVLFGWCLTGCSWLLFGGFFTCLILAIPSLTEIPDGFELYATATAAFALAMVIGFVSLLPGGAGVRELVVTSVLAGSIGAAHGLLAAIAARLLSIAVESVLAGCSWIWLRYTGVPDR